MTANRMVQTCFFLLIPFVSGIPIVGARTLVVGQQGTPCPGAQYSTINAAILAASPSDTIQICPALYAEQLLITKPLTLEGVRVNEVSRVLVQPAQLSEVAGTSATITVANVRDVIIRNLTVDVSNNGVTGCSPVLASIHYLNASGALEGDTIQGAQLRNVQSCPNFFGNGYGALIETDGSQPGRFHVRVAGSTFHDFTRDGLLVQGEGVSVEVLANSFSGAGPITGSLQFSIFILNGPLAIVKGNIISEGNCGPLTPDQCLSARSEGVVFRNAASGSLAEENIITKAQYGIFLNVGSGYVIRNNLITTIDGGGSAIQLNQNVTGSLVERNAILDASVPDQGCGIFESPLGNTGNRFVGNRIVDAYCGAVHVPEDLVEGGIYLNTLYDLLDANLFPGDAPPPVEPH